MLLMLMGYTHVIDAHVLYPMKSWSMPQEIRKDSLFRPITCFDWQIFTLRSLREYAFCIIQQYPNKNCLFFLFKWKLSTATSELNYKTMLSQLNSPIKWIAPKKSKTSNSLSVKKRVECHRSRLDKTLVVITQTHLVKYFMNDKC